jgi:hypothetical protein
LWEGGLRQMSVPGGELKLKGSSLVVEVFVLAAIVEDGCVVRSEMMSRVVRYDDEQKSWSMAGTYTKSVGLGVSHVEEMAN